MTMKGWQLTGKPVEQVCAPLSPTTCRRPCGVFHYYFNKAGGLTMGQGLLGPLFPVTNFTWRETNSLADKRTAEKLAHARASNWLVMTTLR